MGEFTSFNLPTPPTLRNRRLTAGKQTDCRADPEHQEQGLSFEWRSRSVRFASNKNEAGRGIWLYQKHKEVVLDAGRELHHCMAGRSRDLFIGRDGMYENEADVLIRRHAASPAMGSPYGTYRAARTQRPCDPKSTLSSMLLQR